MSWSTPTTLRKSDWRPSSRRQWPVSFLSEASSHWFRCGQRAHYHKTSACNLMSWSLSITPPWCHRRVSVMTSPQTQTCAMVALVGKLTDSWWLQQILKAILLPAHPGLTGSWLLVRWKCPLYCFLFAIPPNDGLSVTEAESVLPLHWCNLPLMSSGQANLLLFSRYSSKLVCFNLKKNRALNKKKTSTAVYFSVETTSGVNKIAKRRVISKGAGSNDPSQKELRIIATWHLFSQSKQSSLPLPPCLSLW